MNAKKLITAAAVLSALAGSAFANDVAVLEGPDAVASANVAAHATRAEIKAQTIEARAKGLIGTGESFAIHKAEPSAPARERANEGRVTAGSGFAYVLG